MKKVSLLRRTEYYKYLNSLRDSGIPNMFGAVPYLLKAFPKQIDEETAASVLSDWMKEKTLKQSNCRALAAKGGINS